MKKLLVVLLALVTALSFSACGTSSPAPAAPDAAPAETAPAQDAPAPDAAPSSEAVGIRFIGQESDKQYIEQALDKFHADTPGIQVELVLVPDFGQMNQNVLAANQAGDDYDLLYVNHVDTLAFIKGEIIQSIDGFAKADGVDYSQIIYPALIDACTYQGELYSITVNTDTRVMAVNKDLFEKYGQKYPTTQAEMLEAAKAMTADDDFGFVNSMTRNPYVPEYEQGVFLMGNGGRLYDIQDGKAVATIDTQEMKDYLNFNLELLNYMPKDCLTMSEDDGRKFFASGKAGMYIFGPWEYTNMPDTEFEYELIKIPAGSKGSASTSGGYQLAIGKGSKHPQEAWQLLKYLTTDAENLALVGATGLPAAEMAYSVAPFTDAKYDMFKEQLKTSLLPEIPVANLNEVVEEFNVYWQDLLYKKISVDDACAQAQESVQKLLDKTN